MIAVHLAKSGAAQLEAMSKPSDLTQALAEYGCQRQQKNKQSCYSAADDRGREWLCWFQRRGRRLRVLQHHVRVCRLIAEQVSIGLGGTAPERPEVPRMNSAAAAHILRPRPCRCSSPTLWSRCSTMPAHRKSPPLSNGARPILASGMERDDKKQRLGFRGAHHVGDCKLQHRPRSGNEKPGQPPNRKQLCEAWREARGILNIDRAHFEHSENRCHSGDRQLVRRERTDEDDPEHVRAWNANGNQWPEAVEAVS